MRRYSSGFVSLLLLTGLLFCTMDSLRANAPKEHGNSEFVIQFPSITKLLQDYTAQHHDEEVCCSELLSDTPRYLTQIQHQRSQLQPERFQNDFSLVFQFSVFSTEQVSNLSYYFEIPDGIHRQFTSEYAINNPSTGPPA